MKNLLSTTGLVVALVLFVAFNVFANVGLKSARLDLTENKLYTLSDGTKNILANLNEPIRLRFYFSKKLASDAGGVMSFAQRVQELLEEYVANSRGKLTLEVADPEPFSEEEDRAVGYGLQGVPASASGELLYFGLAATNTTDQEEIIPFFQESREESLEYDITKVVYNLSNPKKAVVGLLTSLPMEGNPMARFQNPGAPPQDSWFIVEQLNQMFEVRSVPLSAEQIPEDIGVLMVVHPQGVSPQTLFAIDQFVLRGGKLLAFIDPYCDVQQVQSDPQNPMSAMMANRASDLGPLLAAWGLEMPADVLAGDLDSAARVGYQNKPVDYIVWLQLAREKDTLSKDDFVTAQLKSMLLATPGVLSKTEGATTTVVPLLTTSPNAMRVPKSSIQFSPDPTALLERFVSGNEKLMVAARVSGPAKTAYPDGKPATESASDGSVPTEPEAPVLKESQGPINVIVVADADMLEDRFWTRVQNFFGQRVAMPTSANADFAINALDNLSGSNDLISLRSRGRFNRPFDKVVEIRRQAETSFHQREKELEDKLRDTEAKITELQTQKESASSMIISPEQQRAIERFRDEKLKTRQELRKVQRDMKKDIESLDTRLKMANILLVPALVVLYAVGAAFARSQRKSGPRTDAKRS
ncbi:MAG: Gldg family protein [Planctomycetota bacterium]